MAVAISSFCADVNRPLAVAKGCDDCILYHVDGARRHGAEEADLIEALEIAVEMGGGPALMYAGKALEVFRGL